MRVEIARAAARSRRINIGISIFESFERVARGRRLAARRSRLPFCEARGTTTLRARVLKADKTTARFRLA